MANARITGQVVVAALGLSLASLWLGGCGGTTYTYNCVDGTSSKAGSAAGALAGCSTHGGSLSKTPIVSRSTSSTRSRSSFSSSRRRSTSSRSRSRSRSRRR